MDGAYGVVWCVYCIHILSIYLVLAHHSFTHRCKVPISLHSQSQLVIAGGLALYALTKLLNKVFEDNHISTILRSTFSDVNRDLIEHNWNELY